MSAIVPIRRLAVTSGPESAHQSWCARHEDGFCYAAPIAVRVPATATCQAQDFAVEMDAEPGADSPLIALSRDGRDLLDVDVPAALRVASWVLASMADTLALLAFAQACDECADADMPHPNDRRNCRAIPLVPLQVRTSILQLQSWSRGPAIHCPHKCA